ncbi:MAG: hypothetical protein E7036_04540 [Opitutales bacterium]|nr:hypothetical protein [Opitutales bacterium]MBQ2721390.1 hypothetical protein [Opitutales bacterium]
MKDFQGSLIFAMCLLALTAVVFFFKYGQERAETIRLEAETEIVQNKVHDIEKKANLETAEAERLSRIAQKSAESNMEKARIAREMLEKSKRTSALTQKEIVDKLNAQLEREADARLSAEKASAELAKQRDVLTKAVAQTKSDLQKLKDLQGSVNDKSSSQRILAMQKLLKDREAEIERLKKRQAELEAMNALAREAQMQTEKEIEKRGGIVLLPRHKRIFSTR